MATHSSVLAWRIPGTEEPVRLLSVGSHRVGHDLAAAAVFILGLLWWLRWLKKKKKKKIRLQFRRPRFNSGKIPWRREWLLTPVVLPGEFNGQRSLVGYSPWVTKSD